MLAATCAGCNEIPLAKVRARPYNPGHLWH